MGLGEELWLRDNAERMVLRAVLCLATQIILPRHTSGWAACIRVTVYLPDGLQVLHGIGIKLCLHKILGREHLLGKKKSLAAERISYGRLFRCRGGSVDFLTENPDFQTLFKKGPCFKKLSLLIRTGRKHRSGSSAVLGA